ncbi:hypothetical protein GCM10022223_57020 [Kineosporia mesophila]|uniref:Uncharacterized protein n=1 Tax=Kineosporia mesophila TaxID=566012 RepID=A0ABP7AG89_9ACTN
MRPRPGRKKVAYVWYHYDLLTGMPACRTLVDRVSGNPVPDHSLYPSDLRDDPANKAGKPPPRPGGGFLMHLGRTLRPPEPSGHPSPQATRPNDTALVQIARLLNDVPVRPASYIMLPPA